MMWYILLCFLMADTECIADIIDCLQFAAIAQDFPSEGWTFVIDSLSGFTANIGVISEAARAAVKWSRNKTNGGGVRGSLV